MNEFFGGIIVGGIAALLLLCVSGRTPGDMRQRLCDEASWKLPTCAEYVDNALKEAKGIKNDH